jgi:hypothetical protein
VFEKKVMREIAFGPVAEKVTGRMGKIMKVGV